MLPLPPKDLDDAAKSHPLPGTGTEKVLSWSLYRKHQYLNHSSLANTACKTALGRTSARVRVSRIETSQSWLSCRTIQLWGGGEHQSQWLIPASEQLSAQTSRTRGPSSITSSWGGTARMIHKGSRWCIHRASLSNPPERTNEVRVYTSVVLYKHRVKGVGPTAENKFR